MNVTSSIRPKRRFEINQFYVHLLRLTDEEYDELRTKSFPIMYNDIFLWSLRHYYSRQPDSLNLPKLLVLLEKEFGRSSNQYDSWKQSFSFPFLLEIQKSIGPLYYLLKIEDFRSTIEFKFYRIVNDVRYINEDMNVYHKPISEELSEPEIKDIVGYIWGFYEGFASSYLQFEPDITPFFRSIPSSNVVYGYLDDDFFERYIENETEYAELVAKLERDYGQSSKSDQDQICATQEMILKIIAS